MKTYIGLVDKKSVNGAYDYYMWADSCCFDGIKWCKNNGKEYGYITTCDLNKEQISERYEYFNTIKDKLMEYLSFVLNQYHGTNYEECQWDLLLSPALIHLIPSLYVKYETLTKALDIPSDIETDLYRPDTYEVPLDYYDLMFLIYDDDGYHRLLYSILKPFVDKDSKIKENYIQYKRNKFKTYSGSLPAHVSDFVNRYRAFKNSSGQADDDIVIQSTLIKFTLYKAIMESNYGKITGYFYNYYNEIRNDLRWDIDYEWRNSVREDYPYTEDNFLYLMYRIILKLLPIAYIEGFKKLKDKADENYKWAKQPKYVICDATEIYSDELFKIYLMGTDRNISKRIGIQHAGFYGFGGDDWTKVFELSQYDIFFGTGCDSDIYREEAITQMPLVTLFRMPKIELKQEREKILFLNTCWPKNCAFLSSKQCDYYINTDTSFLKLLRNELLSKIEIRFYPFIGFGYDIRESFYKEFCKIKFDENEYLYDSLQDTKLLISSRISTSVLEALRLGIPSFIILDPQSGDHVYSKSSKDLDLIIKLKEIGIIAGTYKEMAQLINDVYDNLDEWWGAAERKKVISELLERYAYFPDNAEDIWVKRIFEYSIKKQRDSVFQRNGKHEY